MSLVVVAQPWSESELAVMLCSLEARGIPTFVQGSGFGSLYPGPQIAFYNARRVMVPDSFAAEAQEALEVFTCQAEPHTFQRPSVLNMLRAILELVLFGWFVPGNRRRSATASNSSSKRTREKPRAA
jgi:hypothetical protein